ncbi:MAG TPA: cytidylate kinase-like family protein, partial [Candidatus Mediterraneibacter cottocaccae]|nr:cytidylate kinase-like family protein [Candidatus Mediterraneibacter cottocaccae]
MKLVITMSRRFGTGASIIAKELSERLDIPVYDKAYIEEQLSDHMYESEAEAIRKLAEKPCIILGRCASDILKDRMNVLNIFVCADKEDRIRRIMEKDSLSYDEAKEKVEKTDEERASYYYE